MLPEIPAKVIVNGKAKNMLFPSLPAVSAAAASVRRSGYRARIVQEGEKSFLILVGLRA